MTDHEDQHGHLLESRPVIPIIQPPPGVPPCWVELTGVITTEDGVTEINEELWVVGFIDPLLDQPAAGGPVVLTPYGALTLGTYVARRKFDRVGWKIAVQDPRSLLESQQAMRAAAQAAASAQRLHIAGPIGPTGRPQ